MKPQTDNLQNIMCVDAHMEDGSIKHMTIPELLHYLRTWAHQNHVKSKL